MPSYTVSKNGYQSATGSFTWADSNITVTLEENKPERLYAWTDTDIVPLYAWTDMDEDYVYFYTLSETPSTNDILYSKDGSGNIIEANPEYVNISEIVSATQIKVWTLGDSYYCNRDTSRDTILDKSITLYTSSTTITTGMILYDNTGTDTGKTIGTINQDGSWDLVSSYTFSFDKDNTVTNYVIDGVTYADDTSIDLADGTHTIIVNGSRTHVYIQGYATCDGPGATISFIVSGSVITLILPNAGGNETFDAATLTYPIQLTIVNEPI